MVKIFKGVLLSTIIAVSLSANDFLAEVTNGTLSDSQTGVSKLDSETMSKVKGGYFSVNGHVEIRNINLGGGASVAEIGKVLFIGQSEFDNKVLCGHGESSCYKNSYVNQQRYLEFTRDVNPAKEEYLVVTATKTTTPSYFGTPIPKFSYGAIVIKIESNGTFYKVRNANTNSYIASDATRLFKNDLSRILVTRY